MMTRRWLIMGVVLAGSAWADSSSAPTLATTEIDSPAIALKVEHHFGRDTARERVMQLLKYWKERFGVKSEWRGDHVFMRGRVYGIEILAALDVTQDAVTGVANDPGFLWRSQARTYVERKLKKYLSPTYDEP